jgi:hypothetical protein
MSRVSVTTPRCAAHGKCNAWTDGTCGGRSAEVIDTQSMSCGDDQVAMYRKLRFQDGRICTHYFAPDEVDVWRDHL